MSQTLARICDLFCERQLEGMALCWGTAVHTKVRRFLSSLLVCAAVDALQRSGWIGNISRPADGALGNSSGNNPILPARWGAVRKLCSRFCAA